MKVVLQYSNLVNKEIKILVIKTTFKIIGAAAAAANLLFEFKIPEKKKINLQITKMEM